MNSMVVAHRFCLLSNTPCGKEQMGTRGRVTTAEEDTKNMIAFDYNTKGVMTQIEKRTAVGDLLGFKIQGFTAWWIWRSYYLGNPPTLEKKLRVIIDWTLDLLFKHDVTRLKTFAEDDETFAS